ncbi:MAG: peptidoglycan-binding protein [Planctomycetes bacterium]|jgi:D-alanyl-D-alanine carboxypeptidase|nr:peptidoglycan-binding protein [Planctomycetota bacterium]
MRIGIWLTALAGVLGAARAAEGAELWVGAESAVVATRDGAVLWSKAPRFRCPPASTAKVMACLAALDHASLDAWVRVSPHAVSQEPTRVGLEAGERFRVADLIRACLICSGNDAAAALAEGAGGTEEKFAAIMTRKAKALGAPDTVFKRASGLPAEGQWTTAADLVTIMRAALEKPFLVKVLGVKETWIQSEAGRKLVLKTHNRLLGDERLEVFLKTGYTRASRSCYVGFVGPDASEGVFAFLSSPKPWPDVRAIAEWCRERNRRIEKNRESLTPAEVETLQRKLRERGFDPGTPDGVFGSRTLKALQAFQRSQGLDEDGLAGPETRRALGMARREERGSVDARDR